MRPADQLAAFVADALKAGRSREEITTALSDAGWTGPEIRAALHAWADGDFNPPVPRPRPMVSAKEAFLYGLMFVSLAVTAVHLVILGFELADNWIPDPAHTYGYYSRSTVRWSISALIVFFPMFLWLNNLIGKAVKKDEGKRRSGVRKWITYLTLFCATLTLLSDLIVVIHAYLNGDLTARFFVKSTIVAVVAGLIFLYFRGEMKEAEDAD
ncbi:DUF5671 domain-containing protein [Actibacterium pelagium]|uniref:DUF5671 domain-containing protein n=1 Tax=Actibacterium pelagium TaxID=2029103 RepID=A0A917EN79_9RHOB|nr:DUF5671 domain-containing protein [Actibacterium pelagium]GGE58876.1 hypothetical protein GCM10011517_28180 [Actibacterium pelagium]